MIDYVRLSKTFALRILADFTHWAVKRVAAIGLNGGHCSGPNLWRHMQKLTQSDCHLDGPIQVDPVTTPMGQRLRWLDASRLWRVAGVASQIRLPKYQHDALPGLEVIWQFGHIGHAYLAHKANP